MKAQAQMHVVQECKRKEKGSKKSWWVPTAKICHGLLLGVSKRETPTNRETPTTPHFLLCLWH
jgi:hypothetical protein